MADKTERELVLALMRRVGALIENDHFVYTGGTHGADYVHKEAIFQKPRAGYAIGNEIATRLVGCKAQIVVAPALGAIPLGQWVAFQMTRILHEFGEYEEVLFAFAERRDVEGMEFEFRRCQQDVISGKRVLVVEDTLNSGASARGVVRAVRAAGGEVVGVGAICNRGKVTAHDLDNVPLLVSLIELETQTWDEESCPMCKQGIPVNTEFGHGRAFVERKRKEALWSGLCVTAGSSDQTTRSIYDQNDDGA